MKKTLMIIIGIALIMSLTGVVCAAPNEQTLSPTGSTHYAPATSSEVYVRYSAEGTSLVGFTVTIPADLNFDTNTYTVDANIIVDDVHVNAGDSFNLSVMSKHGWNMTLHDTSENPIAGSEVPYTMTYDSEVLSIAGNCGYITIVNQLVDNANNAEGTYTLSFKMTNGKPNLGGNYADALIFNAQIDRSVSQPANTPTE